MAIRDWQFHGKSIQLSVLYVLHDLVLCSTVLTDAVLFRHETKIGCCKDSNELISVMIRMIVF